MYNKYDRAVIDVTGKLWAASTRGVLRDVANWPNEALAVSAEVPGPDVARDAEDEEVTNIA